MAGDALRGGRETSLGNLINRARFEDQKNRPERLAQGLLMAEQHGVHDPPREQREQSGDNQSTGEDQDHDAAMIGDPMLVRLPDAEWNRHQREDRQQMDRAPGANQPDPMDPERTDRHRYHQANPDPADRAMRQGSLRRGKLNDAERKGGHGREGMKGDGGSGIEQRRKTHDARLTTSVHRPSI